MNIVHLIGNDVRLRHVNQIKMYAVTGRKEDYYGILYFEQWN